MLEKGVSPLLSSPFAGRTCCACRRCRRWSGSLELLVVCLLDLCLLDEVSLDLFGWKVEQFSCEQKSTSDTAEELTFAQVRAIRSIRRPDFEPSPPPFPFHPFCRSAFFILPTSTSLFPLVLRVKGSSGVVLHDRALLFGGG